MKATTKWTGYQRRLTCGRCGRLGHRAPGCQRRPKAYDRLGIEVEGWWLHERWSAIRAAVNNAGGSVVRDGSLISDSSGETSPWEARSAPGALGQILALLHEVYPDKADPSAGMHIHMSFEDPLDASLLCSEQFVTYALARWSAWGTREEINAGSQFWERLGGSNRYTRRHQPGELESRGAFTANQDRYRWLNFASWERHSTVELRLLPLFQHERLAHSAVTEWVDIVESYLATYSEAYTEQTVVLPSPDTEEVVTAEVELPPPDPGHWLFQEVALWPLPAAAPGAITATVPTATRALMSALRAVV